jgi:hypothetical protein
MRSGARGSGPLLLRPAFLPFYYIKRKYHEKYNHLKKKIFNASEARLNHPAFLGKDELPSPADQLILANDNAHNTCYNTNKIKKIYAVSCIGNCKRFSFFFAFASIERSVRVEFLKGEIR